MSGDCSFSFTSLVNLDSRRAASRGVGVTMASSRAGGIISYAVYAHRYISCLAVFVGGLEGAFVGEVF